MRHAPRALLAGGLGFAVSFLVACGGGAGLLSGDHASTLNSRLDTIASAVESGQCGAASNAASSLGAAVQSLPPSINRTLRRNLNQGVATVSALAREDCRAKPQKPAHTTSTATQTVTTNTNTTPTNTNTTPTNTNTQPPNTVTQQPPVTTTTGPGTTSTGASGGVGVGGGPGGGGTGGANSGDGNSQ
jgi:hypothetical protein